MSPTVVSLLVLMLSEDLPVEAHSVITHLSQTQTSAGSRSTIGECRANVIDPTRAGWGFLHRCIAGTSFHSSVIKVLLLEAMQK